MRRATILLMAIVLLWPSALALAHKGAHKGHDHGHDDQPLEPTAEQIDTRLKRVIKREEERKAKRKQRKHDRREALRKRVQRHLRGGAMTDDVRAELELHARRRALLRQIRLVAAKKADFESVVAADRALARENARHVAFWRKRDMKRRSGKLKGGAQ